MSFKGDELSDLFKDAEAGILPAQKALAGMPQIDIENKLYWNGFQELNADRMSVMGLGRIPLTAMMTYTRFYPFTEEEAYFFVEVLKKVDYEYVALKAEQSAKDKPSE